MRVIFTTPAPGSVSSSTDRDATADVLSLSVRLQARFRNFTEYIEILGAISREITHAGTFRRSATLPGEITSLLDDNKFLS